MSAPPDASNSFDDPRSTLPAGALAIMAAAEDLFTERGFHGTTLRELSRVANVSQPLLYHYFGSKHDLLVVLTQLAVNSVIHSIDEALATCPPEPQHRLSALVICHVKCEIQNRKIDFVANTEVRSLEPAARDDFESKRGYIQNWYDRTVQDGVDQGIFTTPYPQETARAIASMCIAVNSWYRDDGPLPPEEIAHRYSTMALYLVGCNTDPQAIITTAAD